MNRIKRSLVCAVAFVFVSLLVVGCSSNGKEQEVPDYDIISGVFDSLGESVTLSVNVPDTQLLASLLSSGMPVPSEQKTSAVISGYISPSELFFGMKSAEDSPTLIIDGERVTVSGEDGSAYLSHEDIISSDALIKSLRLLCALNSVEKHESTLMKKIAEFATVTSADVPEGTKRTYTLGCEGMAKLLLALDGAGELPELLKSLRGEVADEAALAQSLRESGYESELRMTLDRADGSLLLADMTLAVNGIRFSLVYDVASQCTDISCEYVNTDASSDSCSIISTIAKNGRRELTLSATTCKSVEDVSYQRKETIVYSVGDGELHLSYTDTLPEPKGTEQIVYSLSLRTSGDSDATLSFSCETSAGKEKLTFALKKSDDASYGVVSVKKNDGEAMTVTGLFSVKMQKESKPDGYGVVEPIYDDKQFANDLLYQLSRVFS